MKNQLTLHQQDYMSFWAIFTWHITSNIDSTNAIKGQHIGVK